MTKVDMGEESGPFVRHGAEDKRIRIPADEILKAIAEGRDSVEILSFDSAEFGGYYAK